MAISPTSASLLTSGSGRFHETDGLSSNRHSFLGKLQWPSLSLRYTTSRVHEPRASRRAWPRPYDKKPRASTPYMFSVFFLSLVTFLLFLFDCLRITLFLPSGEMGPQLSSIPLRSLCPPFSLPFLALPFLAQLSFVSRSWLFFCFLSSLFLPLFFFSFPLSSPRIIVILLFSVSWLVLAWFPTFFFLLLISFSSFSPFAFFYFTLLIPRRP